MFKRDMTIRLYEDKINSLEKQLKDANDRLAIYAKHEEELDNLRDEYYQGIEEMKRIRDRFAEEIKINKELNNEYKKEFERLIKDVS